MVASSLGALAALHVLTIVAVDSTGMRAEAAGVAGSVTLSNTKLPVDTAGSPLITGEASVLKAPSDGHYYFYFNNWGTKSIANTARCTRCRSSFIRLFTRIVSPGECYCGAQYPWLESCCESKTW